MGNNAKIRNNIVTDSFYLVSLYNDAGIPITQLHIQKLMFLFEAYYMNKYNVDRLYDCIFQAWDLGPADYHLYNYYKKYGKNNIILNEEQREQIKDISDNKKEAFKAIFDTFKDFSAMQLVNFTHSKGSPWTQVARYTDISKPLVRQWFSQYMIHG